MQEVLRARWMRSSRLVLEQALGREHIRIILSSCQFLDYQEYDKFQCVLYVATT